ncbi:MAG: hypothetical protein E7604_11045 [Ruminococcaceae bacterium]|nr:hypothetical protein [Oscillospiraceae bacterium]
MNYINPPDILPEGVRHTTFFSRLYNHELGYAVYLPDNYDTSRKAYPVHYHFHGWQGGELSDITAMEPLYRNSETIFVFPNVSPELDAEKDLPVEQMFFEELIPHIESQYCTSAQRTISGFSMGGGMAVWYAVKHPGVFTDVIAYAGTFHHYYHKDYMTAFQPVERAEELYSGMRREKWESDRNLLSWFDRTPADAIRLSIRIGTEDPLYCDAEVLHRHLLTLDFPHEYRIIDTAGHTLADII